VPKYTVISRSIWKICQICSPGFSRVFSRLFLHRVFCLVSYSFNIIASHIQYYTCCHKVRTYKEYHRVCPSSELGLSQPLSRQRVFPSPQKQGGGGTLACGWGVGGSPNSDEGHTLWYSLYVRTLCMLCSIPRDTPRVPHIHCLVFYAF
jgi:hypothetical protein